MYIHVQEPGQGVHGARQQDGIIQDINRHAAVVMEGLPDAQAQQQTAEEVAQAVHVARQVDTKPLQPGVSVLHIRSGGCAQCTTNCIAWSNQQQSCMHFEHLCAVADLAVCHFADLCYMRLQLLAIFTIMESVLMSSRSTRSLPVNNLCCSSDTAAGQHMLTHICI